MAPGDPTDPNSDLDLTGTTQGAREANDALKNLQNTTADVGQGFQAMNTITEGATKIFEELESRVQAFGFSLKNVGALSQTQTAQVAMLTTEVLGARQAFEGLAGIDTKGLSTFSSKFQQLQEVIQSSPALRTGQAGIKMVTDALINMGAPIDKVKEKAKEGLGPLMGFGQAFFTSADNGLKLQNVYIQLAARTGHLGDVFNKAGRDLSGINALLATQNKMIGESAAATNLDNKTIEEYYTALGHIPGALEQVVTGADTAGTTMDMLTASIKMAQGTGRSYEEVVKDLHVAMVEYGMGGKDALTFTNRFTEISSKLGIELDVVKSGIMNATSAFKGMTDAGEASGRMAKAAEEMMADYGDTLMKVSKMTGPEAVRVVGDLTGSLKGLSLAQRGFLSAQTGGPGGLLGGIQIEKELREGKIDKVFDRVRQTMQKQFGSIMTMDQVKTEQDAAQFTRQRMMLQQGPLGGLVKNEADAAKILEAFKAKQEGRDTGKLDPLGLQKSVDSGTDIQKKSYTKLDSMERNIDAMRRSADMTNLNLLQKATTAGTGQADFLGVDSRAQRKMREDIGSNMDVMAARAGGTALDFKGRMKKGSGQEITDLSGQMAAEAMTDFMNWSKGVKGTAKSIMDTLKQAVAVGDSKGVKESVGKLEADIQARREAAAQKPLAERQRMLAEAQKDEDKLNKFKENYSIVKPGGGAGRVAGISAPGATTQRRGLGPLPTAGAHPAGATVGTAPRATPAPRTTRGATPPTAPDVHVTETGSGGRIKVDVHVNVKDSGGQGQSVTPTGTPT